jgi:hypothetical protein
MANLVNHIPAVGHNPDGDTMQTTTMKLTREGLNSLLEHFLTLCTSLEFRGLGCGPQIFPPLSFH